ncbi:MAG: TerC family protein, partial [Arthrobacter sp.]
WVPEIPIWFSLLFIAATIAIATVASLLKTHGDENKDDRGQIHGEPVLTADPRNEESEVDKKARPTATSK